MLRQQQALPAPEDCAEPQGIQAEGKAKRRGQREESWSCKWYRKRQDEARVNKAAFYQLAAPHYFNST